MAAVLVTLAQAKAHLRLTTPPLDPGDVDLQLKLDQAEAIILDYLKARADPLWTSEATAPRPVQAAILLLLAHLHVHRGDDMDSDTDGNSDLTVWDAIGRLLVRFRDPALA